MVRILVSLMALVVLAGCTSSSFVPDTTPPVAYLSANPTQIMSGESTLLSATVSDTNGISEVKFFRNGDLIATRNQSPWILRDYPTSAATYRIQAYDTSGNNAFSDSVTVSVSQPMRYKGEWYWVAAFLVGDYFEGYLSMATPIPDDVDVRNAEGGVWRWCKNGTSQCSQRSGVGLLGLLRNSNNNLWYLGGGFYDGSVVKAVYLDQDGRLGYEVNNSPTIKGPGRWYLYNGTTQDFSFAMVRVSTNPTFPASSSAPELSQIPQDLVSDAADLPEIRPGAGDLAARILERRLKELGIE